MAVRNVVTGGLTIPPASAINAAASARGLAAAGARSLVPVTYGVDRQPALILNVLPKAGDANTLLVQCLWGHALHQVDELQLNDQALPAGSTVTSYTGSQATPDAVLVAAFAAQGITYTDTLAGYAYSVLAMPTRSFDGQLNVSARLHGRRVYDRRKDSTAGGSGSHRLADPTTWEWTDCPALCLADWCASTVYGAGESVDWASVPAAADANDALVGTSPTEQRRLLGVTLSRDGVSVAAVGEALRAYAGCWLVPGAAGLRLLADADAAPVASYSHALGQIARLESLQLRDLGAVPTAVEIRYTDTTQTPWREASATASVAGAGTTKPWRLSTVALPGVQRYSQAYREAVERLNKLNLGDLSTTMEVFDAGMAHDIGDIVTVTHPVGLAAKAMRVTDVDMPSAGRWRLALAEHDPASYSTEVVTGPTIADTNRTAAGGPVGDVAGFAGMVSKGRITWAWQPAADAGYAATELRTSDADWGQPTPAPAFRGAANTWGQVVSTAGTYTLWAKHFDVLGNASATSVQASVIVADADLVQDGVGMLTLMADGAVQLSGGDITKTGGGSGWNAGAYSLEAHNSGAFCTFQAAATTADVLAGLTTTPAASASYETIDYSWYCNSAGQALGYVGATSLGAFGTYTASTVLSVVYDGQAVRWLLDGAVMHTLAVAAGLTLYFDSTLYQVGAGIRNVRLGPVGAAGAQGPAGPAGVAGVAGTSVAEVNTYIRSSSTPPAPTGGSFNFSSQTLTPPSGWSVGVPAGTDPVYVARGLATTGTPGATVTPTWGGAAAAFSDGQAVDVIFIRSSSQPSTPGASSGVPLGWYSTVASVPAGADPLWSSFGERSAPGANWTWQAAVRVQGVDGAEGPQGPAGVAGAAGTSVAEINVYNRASSVPGTPSGGSFDFSTQTLTPPASWSVGINPGSEPVYVSRGIATASTPGATATPTWSAPALAFTDGQAVDVIYRRSSSQPSTPPDTAGTPASWYSTVASVPAGSDPLWSSFGRRASPASNWTWDAPVRVQGLDGATGAEGPQGPTGPAGVAGAAGTSVAELNAYLRSTSEPPTPSGGSFNFSTLALTPPVGWSVGVPGGTDPVYVVRGFAYTGTPGATVTPTWGSVAVAFADGQAVDVVFVRSSSQPATPSPSAGVPAGWYATVASVPAGADPLWSSFGERSSISANWVWQAAVRVQGVDGATGPAGPAGTPAISSSLSRLVATFEADSTGEIDGGQSFDTTMQVLAGTTDDTSNWTISRTSSDGSITTSIAGATVTITGIGTLVDNGTVTVTATRSGYPTQALVVQVGKAKRALPDAGPVALLGLLEVNSYAFSPTDAQALFELRSNGEIYMKTDIAGGYDKIGDWYLPTTVGIGASYQARFDEINATGLSSGVTSNALASWSALSSTRYVNMDRTEDGVALSYRLYGISIRRASDGLQVATGQVAMEAGVDV